jgi:hypothetical protein
VGFIANEKSTSQDMSKKRGSSTVAGSERSARDVGMPSREKSIRGAGPSGSMFDELNSEQALVVAVGDSAQLLKLVAT